MAKEVVQQVMKSLMKAFAARDEGSLEAPFKVWDLIQPCRDSLKRLKNASLRNKSWFSVLRLDQRRFIDAIITVSEKIRSPLILKLLEPLVTRLLNALGKGNLLSGAIALMGEASYKIAKKIAQQIVQTAQKWGNKLAQTWLESQAFIRYLVIMSLPQNGNNFEFTFTKT